MAREAWDLNGENNFLGGRIIQFFLITDSSDSSRENML